MDGLMKTVPITESVSFSNTAPFGLIAGPCVLESRELALNIALELRDLCKALAIPFIFKASFMKANRTSGASFRGLSWEEAMPIFREIKEKVGCPVLTDVHHPEQCERVAKEVDVLQIPAFLCRQTELIQAAARTGKPLHLKKGQFLSPQEMGYVVNKAEAEGNHRLLLCERGVCFGYNTLINDMRALPVLAENGYPVIFDATHSVQRPGALGDQSGGDRMFVETLARAAIAVGIAGLFLETHPKPEEALSDGPVMVPLGFMKGLLTSFKRLDTETKALPYAPFSAQSRKLGIS